MNAEVDAMFGNDSQLRGVIRRNEPMRRHTVWGVGGPATQMVMPTDLDDLVRFLAADTASLPLFWLGLGSNLLVRDGGLPATVINTTGRLATMSLLEPGVVRVEAGVPCAKLARFAARHQLAKASFFAGIPGTIGGALAMNAGAFGGETWPLVIAVETVDRRGQVRHRDAQDFEFGYRHVRGPEDEWFVAGVLRLPGGDGEQQERAIRELLAERARSQPIGKRSCGSVFRNPKGDFAGRLIEAAGCKGLRVGGAEVSQKHANFVINSDEASAADIETLILNVQDRVRSVHGVELQPEVRIVGVEQGGRS